MPEIKGFDTYWEDMRGKITYLTVNYVSEDGEIDILNIRTSNGQDPTLVVENWNRGKVVRLIKRQIKKKEKENETV